jgi:glyoxylate/hydroxypyruvate reductase
MLRPDVVAPVYPSPAASTMNMAYAVTSWPGTQEQPMSLSPINVLIASYLEPEHVERIRAVSNRLNVVSAPELLAPPRYPADHTNMITRSPEDEARWRALLAAAEVLFDFDHTNRPELPDLAPRLRWIQGTSAGIGQFVQRMGYFERMPHTVFTTASGVHSQPLAEFCAMAMLIFSRNLQRMQQLQSERRWERFGATDLAGRTLAVVGVGRIGAAVARLGQALGMHVLGVKRTLEGVTPAVLGCDELYGPQDLPAVLRRAEYLVLITPHTSETEQMIGAAELALLPPGAVLINIGRGSLIDEDALIAVLHSGQLGGAALDVFAVEPLPASSPLWSMPNVLISPHSGSTSDRENARLTDLFCENLRRYLAGAPLRNVLDPTTLY